MAKFEVKDGVGIIPKGTTKIEERAFEDCTELTSIKIPKSVTSIGEKAFYGCSSLAAIVIPNSVTVVENWAFCGCTSLISVTLSKKMVYMPEMNGSFSIKHVLPALQPDLSYDDLEGSVHNGGEAMNLYPQIVRPGRTAAEIEADRKSLLEYCALDTLAMVKVWEKLREMAK